MKLRPSAMTAMAVLMATAAPAIAQVEQASIAAGIAADADFERFTPRPSGASTQLDYSFYDEALEFMVLRMGQSTRDGMGRPDPNLGTRRVFGHDSRYRLEGNRVVFSFLEDEALAPLFEYRQDLERIAAEIDIATLPRNEQLAFWMNLHNVAVIEQIGRNYPSASPSRMKLGPDKTSLDTTRFINVGGVAMSPRDIRTRIVFPNWNDPDVIYGFFRGEIGGPSIQRRAFTGTNVDELLDVSAREFVNSLRGVEGYGKNLLVSAIYEEAAPFYFPQMGADLKAHLSTHAEDVVSGLIAEKPEVKVNQYIDTVADLAGGEREMNFFNVESDGMMQSARITPSIARMLRERADKMEKLRKEGLLQGRVIILPPGSVPETPPPAPEVE
ncbi:DUF547 domain-containing protein [Qipengyuania sp. 1XM1-15A]|uniref:DUF547 domain-containing protein n=1 Tax=Qipengyuania xiamenensis TaxID=2867237 RepID=UPI001C87D9F6|nr:DUF547 domain-containing protein [Qipengyuania xiamenensis]MBX7533582.1 DUF547 domain-containing protein [Qipengyuania xiamenensis]